MSQNQAGIVENPGLSYGLFHAVADPVYSWGVVRQVKFPGVNMDIGHVRNVTWAKDNDDKKWVAYNRLRGLYMSALEHAVPERFFSDPSQCNLQGTTTPTAGLPDCPQGISAVKALGIAAAQGQRIYTITQKVYNDNPGIVNTALSAHSYDTQNRVQQSLDAGYEVTIHQSPITESGWTGAGYTAIDPNTGAGAYTIEGGSNGSTLFVLFLEMLLLFLYLLVFLGALALTALLGVISLFFAAIVLPILGVMLAGLTISTKLALLGLGVWTASELLLEGCKKSIGKLIGSIIPVGGPMLAKEALGLIIYSIDQEVYKTAIEGC